MSAPTDRELLELAAKAAGYNVIWNEHWQCFQHRNPLPDAFGGMRHPWTPDTDDGDALRLAVKLGLEIYVDDGTQTVVSQDLRHDWHGGVAEDHGDPYAATRRAIVRAAAEIGRAMPC